MDNTNLTQEVHDILAQRAVSYKTDSLLRQLLEQSNYRQQKWDETAKQVFRLEAALNSANCQNRELRQELVLACEVLDQLRQSRDTLSNEHKIAHENAINITLDWFGAHPDTEAVAPGCVSELMISIFEAYGVLEVLHERGQQRWDANQQANQAEPAPEHGSTVTEQRVTDSVTDTGPVPPSADDLDAVARAAEKMFGDKQFAVALIIKKR